ncbi:MAG: GNAT superfamily N-acetyltransferase [Vicingaceae bacterium]
MLKKGMDFVIRKGRIEDCRRTLELIQELAVFEKAPNEVGVTVQDFKEDGFGVRSIFEFLVAEQGKEIIGVAIFYEKYSTWKGRCTYLEDLIVTESKRGVGAGKALFEGVINYAKERNSGRMEWQVLDWNQPAIDFYKSYNAELDGTWYNGRFTKEQLQNINL